MSLDNLPIVEKISSVTWEKKCVAKNIMHNTQQTCIQITGVITFYNIDKEDVRCEDKP